MSTLARFVRTLVSIPLSVAGVAIGAHVLFQSAWIASHLLRSDVRRALAARHYGAGAADNLVGPEGGQILVNRTLELIDRLWTE